MALGLYLGKHVSALCVGTCFTTLFAILHTQPIREIPRHPRFTVDSLASFNPYAAAQGQLSCIAFPLPPSQTTLMASDFKVGWEKFWASGIGLILILIIWGVLKYMGWEIPRFR